MSGRANGTVGGEVIEVIVVIVVVGVGRMLDSVVGDGAKFAFSVGLDSMEGVDGGDSGFWERFEAIT